MEPMTTVSQVINKLREEGYTTDFNPGINCLVCHQNMLQLHPDDFVVDRHYRFEGPSDPGDEAIVYAVSSEKHNVKGVVVDGYGIYNDDETTKIMKTLHEKATR